MATVTLDDLWVHDATDPTSFVTLVLDAEQEQTSVPGEVRTYANGRRRSVTRVGTRMTVTENCEQVSRADVDWLRTMVGRVVMVREPRQRLFWGVFYDLPMDEITAVDLVNLSLTFQEVTYTAEV